MRHFEYESTYYSRNLTLAVRLLDPSQVQAVLKEVL